MPSSYRVRVEPPTGPSPTRWRTQLRSTIDPDRDPWASLAQVIRTTVVDRGRQLADRLRADASTLNRLNQEVGRRRCHDSTVRLRPCPTPGTEAGRRGSGGSGARPHQLPQLLGHVGIVFLLVLPGPLRAPAAPVEEDGRDEQHHARRRTPRTSAATAWVTWPRR